MPGRAWANRAMAASSAARSASRLMRSSSTAPTARCCGEPPVSASTAARASDASRGGSRCHRLATIAAGCLFAGMQATEWSHFIREGARLTGNPWGVPAFSFTFFVITGLHGAHVLGGIVYLWIMADRIARGLSSAEGLEIAGLYWGFVDLVWVFIWSSIYLL